MAVLQLTLRSTTVVGRSSAVPGCRTARINAGSVARAAHGSPLDWGFELGSAVGGQRDRNGQHTGDETVLHGRLTRKGGCFRENRNEKREMMGRNGIKALAIAAYGSSTTYLLLWSSWVEMLMRRKPWLAPLIRLNTRHNHLPAIGPRVPQRFSSVLTIACVLPSRFCPSAESFSICRPRVPHRLVHRFADSGNAMRRRHGLAHAR